MSKKFHEIDPKSLKTNYRNIYEKAKRMLLISETSCYTYWNIAFWFSQWKRIMKILEKMMEKLYL